MSDQLTREARKLLTEVPGFEYEIKTMTQHYRRTALQVARWFITRDLDLTHMAKLTCLYNQWKNGQGESHGDAIVRSIRGGG